MCRHSAKLRISLHGLESPETAKARTTVSLSVFFHAQDILNTCRDAVPDAVHVVCLPDRPCPQDKMAAPNSIKLCQPLCLYAEDRLGEHCGSFCKYSALCHTEICAALQRTASCHLIHKACDAEASLRLPCSERGESCNPHSPQKLAQLWATDCNLAFVGL